MNKTNNSRLTGNAQKLRREMTEEERHLWYDFLKGLPVTVNRQKVIGRYIVYFYCAEAKLVIEIDGTQHYEQAGKETDSERDAYLNSMGLHVLRYSNRDVNRSFAGVCAEIMTHLPTSSASLRSAPSGPFGLRPFPHTVGNHPSRGRLEHLLPPCIITLIIPKTVCEEN